MKENIQNKGEVSVTQHQTGIVRGLCRQETPGDEVGLNFCGCRKRILYKTRELRLQVQ